MKELLTSLEKLKKSGINNLVNTRIAEFSEIKDKASDKIFTELCFCIMTANCSAEKCIEIHENIGDDFLNLSQYQLTNKFKELGYRFPNIRSKYIVEARCNKEELNKRIKSNKNGNMLREWIVSNIKGIGYKEASHFLRNIGFDNYAIVDFHIIDLLVKHGLIEKPKTMTKKKYLEIEELLKDIAERLGFNLAELDLYLWYMETKKVLK
ncbi:MAG: N-glycosylase/DNA lyase [Promethearchaeota archaeon]|nr:MAG: N-glycosylase/DNA lyase [Candidatus Lokiarchaeota archaeon]